MGAARETSGDAERLKDIDARDRESSPAVAEAALLIADTEDSSKIGDNDVYSLSGISGIS